MKISPNFPVRSIALNDSVVLPNCAANSPRCKVLVLFGTRPEIIKLAPVIHELKLQNFQVVAVSSGQQRDLAQTFVKFFNLEIAHDLRVMRENQTPNQVCAKIITALDALLELEKPDLIIVQGDTATALAGAMCAFNRKIPIGHIEAGLRSGDAANPFPEEMNRRLITQLANLHFAATEQNKLNLLAENVADDKIFVTGNPVTDALMTAQNDLRPSSQVRDLLRKTQNSRRILLTTHRREAHGATMRQNLMVLREFIEQNADTTLIFPIHPNPQVRAAVRAAFLEHNRVFLLDPVDYTDFICLMKHAWLIVSDSGGVQEEAPSLGKPLLILRETTERPEAVESGTAKLVGDADNLRKLLNEININAAWIDSVKHIPNPFGDGRAATKIVAAIAQVFAVEAQTK